MDMKFIGRLNFIPCQVDIFNGDFTSMDLALNIFRLNLLQSLLLSLLSLLLNLL